jgi:transcriptional regulator with XRE-family HTH domain
MKNADQLENTTGDRRTAKKFREMFDVTQEEVAHNAGISGSKLSLYESGFVDLTDAELRRLNKVLNALAKKSDLKPMPGLISLISGRTDDTFAERYASWSEKKRINARRSLRRQVKLTQIEVAREIGIQRRKLINWEAGRLELSDAEFTKWQQVIVAAIVKRKKADPWARLEIRIEDAVHTALQLHKGQVLDDPLIAEIIESFRREIAELKENQSQAVQVDGETE